MLSQVSAVSVGTPRAECHATRVFTRAACCCSGARLSEPSSKPAASPAHQYAPTHSATSSRAESPHCSSPASSLCESTGTTRAMSMVCITGWPGSDLVSCPPRTAHSASNTCLGELVGNEASPARAVLTHRERARLKLLQRGKRLRGSDVANASCLRTFIGCLRKRSAPDNRGLWGSGVDPRPPSQARP